VNAYHASAISIILASLLVCYYYLGRTSKAPRGVIITPSQESKTIIFDGAISSTIHPFSINAQSLIYDLEKQEIKTERPVITIESGGFLRAQQAYIDLENQIVHLHNEVYCEFSYRPAGDNGTY